MDEEQRFHFPNGIPGFENYEDFQLAADDESPLAQLVCTQDEHIGFVLARPDAFFPSYIETLQVEIFKEEKAIPWPLNSEERIEVWTIVGINNGDVLKSTANLRAPLLLNQSRNEGLQLILDSNVFLTKQPLFEQLNPTAQEGGAMDAGTGAEAE